MDSRTMLVAVIAMTFMMLAVEGTNNTASNNTTSNNMASNNTASNNTASNNTASNNTASNNTASNNTASNNTASNNTASNNTASNNTASNNTASNNTASNNATSNNSSTVAVSVSELNGTISRANCGKDRACVETPTGCDPAVAGSCLFVSTKAASRAMGITFEIRGESSGYIAVGLSTDSTAGGNDTTYVCANNNSTVQFIPARLDNNTLTPDNSLSVSGVQGSVSGSVIQCVFTAQGLNASKSRAASNTFHIILSIGNFTNGMLGTPSLRLITANALDLTNPNSTATTNTNATTAAPATTATTTGGSSGLQLATSQALLILLGVLGLGLL